MAILIKQQVGWTEREDNYH